MSAIATMAAAAIAKRNASSVGVSTPLAYAMRARIAIAPNAAADASTYAMPRDAAARDIASRGKAAVTPSLTL